MSRIIGQRALVQEAQDLVVGGPIRNGRELEVEDVGVREPVLHSAASHLSALGPRDKAHNVRA